jgi:general secretion pathway protein G
MRKAIDEYTADKKRPPESLQTLVDEKYLRTIPVDPLTYKSDWIPHYIRLDIAGVGPVVGIDDVHTASGKTSTERTLYNEW